MQRLAGARRVALVEDEVEHVQDDAEPVRPLGLGREVEAPAGLPIRCFARLIRWAIVASGTRNAFAISAGPQPADRAERERQLRGHGQRRVAAQEQERERVVVVDGREVARHHGDDGSPPGAAGRSRSATRPPGAARPPSGATPAGRRARPSSGHCCDAATSASWTASSHASNWPWRRTSVPRTCGASSRSRSSIRGASTVAGRRCLPTRRRRRAPAPRCRSSASGASTASRAASDRGRDRRSAPSAGRG